MDFNQANASGGRSSCPSWEPPCTRGSFTVLPAAVCKDISGSAILHITHPATGQAHLLTNDGVELALGAFPAPPDRRCCLQNGAWARRGGLMLSSGLQGCGVEEGGDCRRANSRHVGFACKVKHQKAHERHVGHNPGVTGPRLVAKNRQDQQKLKMS